MKRQQKILKVALGLGFGLGRMSAHPMSPIFSIRGGGSEYPENVFNVDDLKKNCHVDEGLSYLDQKRIRDIIRRKFGHKAVKHIIYITASAACMIAKDNGLYAPFPFTDDFGVTNIMESAQKLLVTVLGGGAVLLVGIQGIPLLLPAFGMLIAAVRIHFVDIYHLPGTPIDAGISTQRIQPRTPFESDIVTVNLPNPAKKLPKVPDPIKEKSECLIPGYMFRNNQCIEERNNHFIEERVVSQFYFDIPYDQMVTVGEVANLKDSKIPFGDIFELGTPISEFDQSSTNPDKIKPRTLEISNFEHNKAKPKGKMVKFKDKFPDPQKIDETATWEMNDSNSTDNAATKSKQIDLKITS